MNSHEVSSHHYFQFLLCVVLKQRHAVADVENVSSILTLSCPSVVAL